MPHPGYLPARRTGNVSHDNEHLRMIDDCEARESRLSKWDVQFLDSIRRRLENDATLTRQQIDKLGEIWDHATAAG